MESQIVSIRDRVVIIAEIELEEVLMVVTQALMALRQPLESSLAHVTNLAFRSNVCKREPKVEFIAL